MEHAPGTTATYSIVVPARDEQHSIGDCLRSLAGQQVDEHYEVILVDNGSVDQTVSVARRVAGECGVDLRVVQEARPGRGAARQAGFAAATGRVLFSADADSRYPPTWMHNLLAALAEPGVVAATTTSFVDDLGPLRNLLVNLGQPLVLWFYRLVLGHYCLCGFSFAVPREVYTASGGFDANLNADEDADLSRRVAREGRTRLIYASVRMSGRRFGRGLLRGLWAYVDISLRYRFNPGSVRLSDIR